MNKILTLLFLTLLALGFGSSEAHAHGHLAASVNGSGTTLILLDSEASAMPAVNPETYHLMLRTSGAYSGYYSLDEFPRTEFIDDYFSFTVLSVDENDQMPLGSEIWMTMTLISAPAGGSFAFWESGATGPTFSLNGTGQSGNFVLSEWADFGVEDDAQDPWGHIHHRAFTASTPGDYSIQFNLYDSQGELLPSSGYVFNFVAVPEPGSFALIGVGGALLVLSRRKIQSLN